MPQTVAELYDAALALPDPERAALAELLSATLHPTWKAELRRRAGEVDSGQVRAVPWDEVRKGVQDQLDGAGQVAHDPGKVWLKAVGQRV